MSILHDLRCDDCGNVEENVVCEAGHYPPCFCGGRRDWVPAGFATDVYGVAEFNRGTGREHSSTREAEKFMRQRGYEPAGDSVGGSKDGPNDKELRIKKHTARWEHAA